MNLNAFIVSCLLLTVGCSNRKILINSLYVKDNLFCNKENFSPFSGTAISKFDTGQISNEINFKDGIPSGQWFAYGYRGEIVQNGNYKPIVLKDKNIDGTKVKRINICTVKEGTQTYVDLYFITNDTTVKINKSTIGIYGEKFKINELKNLDTTLINEIICSKVEFDKDN